MIAGDAHPDVGRLLAEIEALKDLAGCRGYIDFLAPRLRAAREEHLSALSAPGNALRDEHVQAYRLAAELDGWVEAQIALRRSRLEAMAPGIGIEEYE